MWIFYVLNSKYVVLAYLVYYKNVWELQLANSAWNVVNSQISFESHELAENSQKPVSAARNAKG